MSILYKIYLYKFFDNLLFEGKNELLSENLKIYVGVNEKNVGVNTNNSILALIERNPKITINKMTIELNKTPRTVQHNLKKLKEAKNLQELVQIK